MFGCDTYVCDAAHVSALTITTKEKKPMRNRKWVRYKHVRMIVAAKKAWIGEADCAWVACRGDKWNLKPIFLVDEKPDLKGTVLDRALARAAKHELV